MKTNNIYYLYVYLDPRKPGLYKYQDLEFSFEPFYVGIGKTKDRHLSHLDEAYKLNYKSYKCYKIRKIKKETGNNPIILKLFENLSVDDAIKLEVEYITKIGRYSLKLGPLTNQTDGGLGILNYKWTKKQKDKQRKVLSKIHENNPNLAKEHGKKIKRNYIEKPEIKEKISKKVISLWKDKKYKNIQSESHKNYFKNNPNSKKEIALFHSKTWIIVYPDGHEEKIKNLAEFCRQNNLNASSMWLVLVGRQEHHKNYKIIRGGE